MNLATGEIDIKTRTITQDEGIRADTTMEGLAKLKPVLAPDDSATVRRSDGNTVQIDQELLEMAGNTTNVEVLTQFVSGSLRQLRTAVLGRNV